MTAAGRATPSTRATSVSGAAGSSGTATRPAATIATSAAAYSSGLAEPDHDPRAGRQPGRVQPSFNVGDGAKEPGVAERRRPAGVRQVQVGAVAGGRLLDPIAYQGSHPSGQYIIRGSL